MAKKNAASDTNPFESSSTSGDDITATADAHSAFDVETIGEDDITPAELAADKMADNDLAVQDTTMETQDQEQGMGTPSSTFAPVGSSSVGVGGDNPFDTTTAPVTDAPPAETPHVTLPSASEVASAAKDAASAAKDKVSDAADQAKVAAGQAADQVKAQASEVLSQTKETATQAFGKAKENVVSQLENQKGRATDSLGGLTAALRQTGDQFKSQNVPFVPDYAEQFAGQLDRVSDYLKQNNIDQLAHDAEAFARRNPALFIGGAFLLGIGIARFIKASGTNANAYNPDNLPAKLSDASSSDGTVPSSYTVPTERQDIFTDDGIPSGRVVSAHNYVPGIGVVGNGSE